jgi:hypothetical protein
MMPVPGSAKPPGGTGENLSAVGGLPCEVPRQWGACRMGQRSVVVFSVGGYGA